MSMRHAALTGFVVCVFTVNCLSEAGATEFATRPAEHCGRDCLCFVMEKLRVGYTCEEVGARLDHRPIVSLGELTDVAKSFSLHATALSLPVDCLASAWVELLEEDASIAMIVLIGGTGDPAGPGHFMVILECANETLRVFDASTTEIVDIPHASLLETGLPVLLISRRPVGLSCLSARHRFLRSLSFFAGSQFTIVAGCVLCLMTCYQMSVSGFSGLRVQAFGCCRLVAVIQAFGKWLPGLFTSRVLALAGLSVGAMCLIAFGVRRELEPVSTDTKILDLGRVPVGSIQVSEVRLTNRSLFRSVEIDALRPNCSCISTRLETPRIAALGTVSAGIETQVLRAGMNEYVVAVQAHEQSDIAQVRIRYEGFESASLSPAETNVGAIPYGQSYTGFVPIRLRNFIGALSEIQISSSSRLDAGVAVQLSEDSKAGCLNLRFESSGAMPLGKFAWRVIFETSNGSERSFFLMIYGEVVPPMVVDPPAFILSELEDGQLHGSVIVTSRFRDPSGVLPKATSTSGRVSVVEGIGAGQSAIHFVLQVPPLPTPGVCVDVFGSGHENDHIRIPVYYIGTRLAAE